MLRKAIRMADENADRGLLVVVPTLDGVQFNLSFLELLVKDNWPVYVCSGWRSPTIFGRETNYKRRADSLGWLLSLSEEADDFAEIVMRIRKRNNALCTSIRAGLKKAVARGKRLGAHRKGSYRFTVKELRRGGQETATRRQQTANQYYAPWVADICLWRTNGESLRMIAMRLADKRAVTPDGRPMGPMLIHRILRREFGPKRQQGTFDR
jgi:hypothetical protein